MKSIRATDGFTLLEIIVVVLVFSVMAAMAYGGLNSVLRTRGAIESSMRRTADFQRAFQRLRGDFQNLRDRAARDSYGDAQPPLSISREGELELVRGGWRNPTQSGRSSLERVRYRLKDHELHRANWRVLDLPQQSEPSELTLLREVDEVRWRFLDTGREWQAQWPNEKAYAASQNSRASEPPPLAVELTLVTRDWGELRLLFRTPQAGLISAGQNTPGAPSSALITRRGLLPLNLLGLSAVAGGADTGRSDTKPDPDEGEGEPPPQDPEPPAPLEPAGEGGSEESP